MIAGVAGVATKANHPFKLGEAGYWSASPIKWNHLIDKDAAHLKELEHVLIEKVEQLFRDML
jgi:hypothetical protein